MPSWRGEAAVTRAFGGTLQAYLKKRPASAGLFCQGRWAQEARGSRQTLCSSCLGARATCLPSPGGVGSRAGRGRPVPLCPHSPCPLPRTCWPALRPTSRVPGRALLPRKGDIMTQKLERDTQGLGGWYRSPPRPGKASCRNRLKIWWACTTRSRLCRVHSQPSLLAPQPRTRPWCQPPSRPSRTAPTWCPPQQDSARLSLRLFLGSAPAPVPAGQADSSAFSKQMPHHPFPSPAPDSTRVLPGQAALPRTPTRCRLHGRTALEGTKPPAMQGLLGDQAALLGVSPRPGLLDAAGPNQ